jgi:hypothetical protein
VPTGSIFKGYQDYVVQDLIIQPNNTCYRLEQWQRGDGSYVIAKAPGTGHFGPTLVSYILYQYHHQHVTQPLLLEQLLELGVEISAGQLSQILTHSNDEFHQEKDAVLSAGIEASRYLQTDDTGARHEGKNGYIAPTLAMICLRGLRAPRARAGSIFWSCWGPSRATM